MVIYLSLFKGITLLCFSLLPSSAYFLRPFAKPASPAELQTLVPISIVLTVALSLPDPGLNGSKPRGSCQTQISITQRVTAHPSNGKAAKYCSETCKSQAGREASWKTISTVWAETGTWGGCSAVLAQVMANNWVHSDTLAKHGPVNSKQKYSAVFSVLIKELENKLQDWRKHPFFWYICGSLFSQHKYIKTEDFQMECIELQSHIQLKQKPNHVSLPDFYKPSLTREIALASQPHLIHVIALWHYVQL